MSINILHFFATAWLIKWHSQVASGEHAYASGLEFYKDWFTLVCLPAFFPITLSYLSLSPVAEMDSPSQRHAQAKLASTRRQETSLIGQEKQETSKHLPQEVKSKLSLRWAKKHCCCFTSCTCDHLATTILLVLDTQKHSLWLHKRVHSQLQIMLALFLTIYNLWINTINEQRWS